jgi:hypothetical protein
MFRNILIFTILLLVSLSTSNAQLKNKKEFRLKETKPELIEPSESKVLYSQNSLKKNKSLLLAGSLSFIIPGAALGQFYKEEFINGGIRVGISVLCVICFLVSPGIDFGGGGDGTEKILAAGIYAVNWLASVVDALLPSQQSRYSKYRKYKLNF